MTGDNQNKSNFEWQNWYVTSNKASVYVNAAK